MTIHSLTLVGSFMDFNNEFQDCGQSNVGNTQLLPENGWKIQPLNSKFSKIILSDADSNEIVEKPSNSLPAPKEGAGVKTRKRKRLLTSQKKKLRRLMATGTPYEKALKTVLDEYRETERPTVNEEEEVDMIEPSSKRTKGNPSCSETTEVILSLGIVPRGYPIVRLNLEEQKAIEKAIIAELHKLPEDGIQVRFHGCSFKSGWIVVNCADETSILWLKEVISQIHPIEKDVMTVEGNDIPKPITVSAFFPKCSLQADEILRVLHTQNRTLPTETWKILKHHTTPSGTTLILSLDDNSMCLLAELKNSPYFDMSRVQFRVRDKTEKRTEVEEDKRPSTSKQTRIVPDFLTRQSEMIEASSRTNLEEKPPVTYLNQGGFWAGYSDSSRSTILRGNFMPPDTTRMPTRSRENRRYIYTRSSYDY